MSLSPACLVNGAPPPIDVAANSTVTVSLKNTQGVLFWGLTCVGTDELNSSVAVNSSLAINLTNYTATFTAPGGLGSAIILQSTVGSANSSAQGSGVDANGNVQASFTTTFKVNVLTSASLRVTAINETFEQGAAGWSAPVNAGIRAAGGTASIPAPLFVPALRGATPVGGRDQRTADGFTTQGDFGQGLFVWDAADTRADDGGTILKNTGIATGRWNRVFTGGIHPKWFGCKGDGSTDDTANFALADTAAQNYGTHIDVKNGTYKLTAATITSDVEFGAGAQLAGTVTFNGGVRAWPTQQIFASGATVTFGTTSRSKAATYYVKWWGAVGDSGTDDTAPIKSALSSFQTACQASPQFAPELLFTPGTYVVKQSSNTNYGPVLELVNCNGGKVRGTATGQARIFMNGIVGTGLQTLSPRAVVRLTNCQENFEWGGIDIICGTPFSPILNAAVLAGATSVQIADATTGGQLPLGSGLAIPATLAKYPWYAEDVVITQTSTLAGVTTCVLQKPTQYAYDAGLTNAAPANYLLFSSRYCLLMYRDAGQSGNSTQCYIHDVNAGNSSIINCLYYVGTECNGGTGSASDGNNDQHVFERVKGSNAVWGGAYIGHLNSIANVFRDCALVGNFYGIHAPSGGSFYIEGNTVFDGKWGAIALAGNSAGRASHIIGGLSEAGGRFIVADDRIPNGSYVTTAYTQPSVGSTAKIYVGSNTGWVTPSNIPAPYYIAVSGGGYYQYVSAGSDGGGLFINATFLGAPTNEVSAAATKTIPAGATIGLALWQNNVQISQYDSKSSAAVQSVTASAAAGATTLTLSSINGLRQGDVCVLADAGPTPGTGREKVQIKTITATSSAGAGTVTLYAGTVFNHTTNTSGTYALIVPAWHIDISGTTSDLSTVQASMAFGGGNVACGPELHLMDVTGTSQSVRGSLAFGTSCMVGWTLENAFLTHIRAGWSQLQPAPVPLYHGADTRVGFSLVSGWDGHQADNLSDSTFMPAASDGIVEQRVRTSNSALGGSTLVITQPNTTTVVDRTSGAVNITLATLQKWQYHAIKVCGTGVATVTVVVAGGAQAMEVPGSIGTFQTTAITLGNGKHVWSNDNSGTLPAQLTLDY